MAEITGTINGGTAPYSIVVRKVGEVSGNRCTGSCNNFPITFTHDDGTHEYYFIVTDSSGEVCTVDSRVITGGIGALNCDPVCNISTVIGVGTCGENASIPLTINGGEAPYTITVRYIPATGPIDPTNRFISYVGNTLTFTPAPNTLLNGYIIDITDANDCFYNPTFQLQCGQSGVNPDFASALIQPTCSSENGGVPVNAVMKLTNITNATRYIVRYTPSFTGDCTTSTGTITGNSIDISLTPPVEGSTTKGVIRVFNGSGCSTFKDLIFEITSPYCSQKQITYLNLDYSFIKNTNASNTCPDLVLQDYDVYVTLNTSGVAENGQKSLTKGGFERNVPNGNDVPNIFISSSFDINHGPGAFYRWGFNVLALMSRYPTIKNFTFDIFAKKLKGSPVYSTLTPQINLFNGVTMTKITPQLECNGNLRNATDHGRQPQYDGKAVVKTPHTLNPATDVYRKIATFRLETLTPDTVDGTNILGKVIWTDIPE